MARRVFEKQLAAVETAPRGRVERYCEYDVKTKEFSSGVRRSQTLPPNEVSYSIPIRARRGVVKPG